MRRVRALVLAAVAAIALAACATRPTRAPAPVDLEQAALTDGSRAAVDNWRLSGRVAISSGRGGGSGRLDWTQQGERYVLDLSAPVTRQGWRLSGDAASARLEGIEGGPRESADVEDLLWSATGWEIPVRAMVDWVRGVAAPREAFGPAQVAYGADSLPVSIDQAGWRIAYSDWYEAGAGQPAMPRRIEARRGEARVRLVVDDWTLVAAAAPALAFDDLLAPDEQLRQTLAGLRLEDPAADMRARVAAGDLRPVGVCGFACLAPGEGAGGSGELRIIDHSGDVIHGDAHLRLKHQAEAYARAYNAALAAWRKAHPDVPAAREAD